MAVTLAQSALLSETDLQRGVIETFIIESSVLDRMSLLEIEGNAYAYTVEESLPGVEFRAVNAAYAESTGTVNPRTETLVILGGDADVDSFIVQTRSNLNDQRAIQTRMKVKSATYKYQDTFINGDVAVDANSFDGLKKRLTGAQVIAAGANGLAVIGANDNDRYAFLDALDNLIAAVGAPGPDALYMNRSIRQKIQSSARRLAIFDQTIDDFGRTIASYNGIPLLDIGTKADGSQIIPQTETQGTAAGTTSSIYAVKYGLNEADGGVTGLTNGGVQVIDFGNEQMQDKPVYRTRIEFFCGMALFGGKAGARLTGVLNA
ncbi:MAG: hypothetical protein M3457_02870 [Chloroflexota bacterium]|nr:hypothetical protein [Chloroflexota bacterium]